MSTTAKARKPGKQPTPWTFDKSAWTKPHMHGEVITVQLRTGEKENVIVDQTMAAWGRIEARLVTKTDSEIHSNAVLSWKMIGG